MFGQWCVTSSDVQVRGNYRYVKVRCKCGTYEDWKAYDNLRSGKSKGCDTCARGTKDLKREAIYNRWYEMKRRCMMDNHPCWKNYGGRGIGVAKEWMVFQNYYDYVTQLEGYAPGIHLDRINNDGNYEPGNVRWVTSKQNANNTRVNIKVEYNNEILSITQFARDYANLSPSYTRRLYKKGKTPQELVELGKNKRGSKNI